MEDAILVLFGQPLTRFGLLCAAALLLGLIVCGLFLRRKGGSYGTWIRFSLCVIVCAWFFARLLFGVVDWINYILVEKIFDLETGVDPFSFLYFWRGGYSLMGAALGAVIGATIAEKWTGSARGFLRDLLAFGIPAAVLVERLAEAGTGLGRGDYVTAQWLINTGLCPQLYGDYVQPVYLYEAVMAVILFVIMLCFLRKPGRDGLLCERFLLLFGLTQVIMESLRADGHMVTHFVHVQEVYAILFAAGVALVWSRRAEKTPGRGRRLALGWVVIFAAAGVAIWAEFGVDRWGNPLLAYGVLILCMLAIGLTASWIRRMEKA